MTMTTRVPPWALAVAAMASVQLGAALSVHLFPAVGTAGTAWLRLTMGAAIFLAIARPPLNSPRTGHHVRRRVLRDSVMTCSLGGVWCAQPPPLLPRTANWTLAPLPLTPPAESPLPLDLSIIAVYDYR